MNVKPTKLIIKNDNVIIIIPYLNLKNGTHINLCFDLKCENLEEFNEITGIETVTIKVGECGKEYILEDNKANVFYADLLHLNYMYRLRFGNNGAKDPKGNGGLGHFLNLNTPCCARAYDPANKTKDENSETPPAPTPPEKS